MKTNKKLKSLVNRDGIEALENIAIYSRMLGIDEKEVIEQVKYLLDNF